MTTSFTRGVRYPAPDVSRGFMLLLVAVANVPAWTGADGRLTQGGLQALSATFSTADSVWIFIRTLLVDERAIPLFAMLFGFGLATMINRRIKTGTQTYLQTLPGTAEGREPTPAELAWAREQATVDARRLVRRRGWWMILFGAVHGIFFPGDIIGAYGVVAVVFAGWLARKHRKRILAAGITFAILATLFMYSFGLWQTGAMSRTPGADSSTSGSLPWFIGNLTGWVFTLMITLLSMVIPAMFIGARLADTDLLAHPEQHRRLLIPVAVGGLGIGILGGLHAGLAYAGWGVPMSSLDPAATEVTGLAAGCGWLALLALYAGGPAPDGQLTGLRRLASAVGRRSMTAYLSQTILFGLTFTVIPGLLGTTLAVNEAPAAAIAVGVWTLAAAFCITLEHGGHAGPFETLLRTAVARSQRNHPHPPPPQA